MWASWIVPLLAYPFLYAWSKSRLNDWLDEDRSVGIWAFLAANMLDALLAWALGKIF